ncbi:MAG: peptidase M64 [Acidobacteria bacterium]|uniref:Peptidase M64 n=1 Tax=Candidatus Polarisedimenticola svalbardensis TaxID=2886004 RepID=A0A8J7CCU0_9BACT|nr:peptidase M64 [Candidatus Polarisedimenticola svalbardensis]
MCKSWSRPAVVLLVLIAVTSVAQAAFDDDFTGKTLRVDYFHTGTAAEEIYSLDRMRIEGDWPGSRVWLLDGTDLGKYRVELADLATHRVMFSRGFASIYGEWETTGEAASGTFRTLEEAVRIPEPKRPAQLRLRKRTDEGSFQEVWQVKIDPSSRFVDRAPLPDARVVALLENGDPATKVDLLVLGDGFTSGEMADYRKAAEGVVTALFAEEPFRSRKSDFNVWIIETPADRSGVSRPRAGVFRNSPLGARYNSLDSERYILSLEDRAWRDAAAAAPYDTVIMLVNERKYGGGGIFNLYSTASAGSAFAPYLYVHEFGHHFAGLGDEYYTSPVSYESDPDVTVEPWEPNVTALLDPTALKWGDLASGGAPVPTPWGKEAYDSASRASQKVRAELRASGAAEEKLEELFVKEQVRFTKQLGDEKYAGKVGAFEGAGYQPRGLYRPSADCIMFTRDEVGFCPVCRQAINRMIDLHTMR